MPYTDWYTYTVPSHPWIDLHWGFEVLLSWGYAHGGVVALNLAKCAITAIAVAFLILARRRDWPLWVIVLAWLPAIFVLGGRMYVRPETLSLFYLSIYLAVIFRWDHQPWLAFVLPVVQVLWVNTQGLFVFGPILLGLGLIDAAVRPRASAGERKRWWRIVAIATVLPARLASRTLTGCAAHCFRSRLLAHSLTHFSPIQSSSSLRFRRLSRGTPGAACRCGSTPHYPRRSR